MGIWLYGWGKVSREVSEGNRGRKAAYCVCWSSVEEEEKVEAIAPPCSPPLPPFCGMGLTATALPKLRIERMMVSVRQVGGCISAP